MSADKKYTIKYAAVQGFYWAAFCSLLGFTAVFLLDKGYTNSEIGIVIALSNVIAVFLQPLIASLADKHERLTLKSIIWLWAAILILVSAGLVFFRGVSLILSVFITVAIVAIMVIQPFINTISVRLEEQGIAVNFGVCRACGSLSYALVSTIIGMLLKHYPTSIIPFSTIVLILGLFISVGILSGRKKFSEGQILKRREQEKKAQSLGDFLLSHKKFSGFLIGVTLIFYYHILSNNFLFQIIENVGGDSSNMGIASAICAVVELPVMIFFIKIVKKADCHILLRISGIFFAAKSILYLLAGSVGMIYATQLLQVGGYALFIPASVYYVGKLLDRADMVKGQSLVTTAITLGGVFASVIGGKMLDDYGVGPTLFVGAVVALIGVISMSMSVEKV